MIWKFIWKHRGATLIFLCFSVAFIWLGTKFAVARRLNRDYVRQLQNYEAVTEIHEGAYLAQTARLDLAETLIREYNPQPGTKLAYQAQVQIVYQTRTIKVPVVETQAVYSDDHISVDGHVTTDDTKPCPTVTALDLAYTLKPLTLDLFVTRGPGGEYATIIDTHDPAIVVGSMKTRLDPAVFHDDRHWFAGAGPLVRLRDYSARAFEVSDLGLAGQIGYAGQSWWLAGQILYFDGFGAGLIAGGRW